MSEQEKAFAQMAATLERYRKNKTMVPAEDLKGRYKGSFEKLIKQLETEIRDYLTAECYQDLLQLAFPNRERVEEAIRAMNAALRAAGTGPRAAQAASKRFDAGEVRQIAREGREAAKTALYEYIGPYTCLYAVPECFDQEHPKTPELYNRLVDRFWNYETGEWEKREHAQTAMLISVAGVEK